MQLPEPDILSMAILMASSCPDHDEILRFAAGNLPDDRLKELATHIEDCDRCGLLLDAAQQLRDGELLSELQSVDLDLNDLESPRDDRHLNHHRGAEGVCHSASLTIDTKLVEAACKLPQSRTVAAKLDSGKRLLDQLAEGPVTLGRFQILAELGVGSFGHVFKALDTELNRLVALKVQRAGALATDGDIERFLHEAQSTARLNHPNIVALYDTVRYADDTCFLVSEFVNGPSLETHLSSRKFSQGESVNLIACIADALQYAHDCGIIHRDIKPSNILLDQHCQGHVADFGLAKCIDDTDGKRTSVGWVLGTPAYMSPEQARGDSSNVDARSDVYSLGVVLYEMLTGERPFSGHQKPTLAQIGDAAPRPLRQHDPGIPRDLETICLKALDKSPGSRYQTAGELADDLRRFVSGKPIRARRMGLGERLWRWSRVNPVAASLLLAIPLVTIGGFAYLSWLSKQFVRSTALESTRMEANMLEDINEFYSEQVIGPLDQNIIPVTHRYSETDNSLPLPFTFMIDAGERISHGESGMSVRIYSDYPWRSNTGPANDFERRAIEALGLGCRTLNVNQDGTDTRLSSKEDIEGRSYHEFSTVNGLPFLRYARAQVMKQSCVDCHNREADSPKHDWVVGEVAGVLSITRPLKRDSELATEGLKSAFYLIGSAALFLTGCALSLFWSMRNRPVDRWGV